MLANGKTFFHPLTEYYSILYLQVTQLRIEIEDVQREYDRMVSELQSLGTLKEEKKVQM